MVTKPLIFKREIDDKPIINKPGQGQAIASSASLEDKVIAAIQGIYDPEIPVNIYDLGLIYTIAINEKAEVSVTMTLTAPACPVAGTLPGQVENTINAIEGVADANVELVWDPPWHKELMTDEARLTLGLF